MLSPKYYRYISKLSSKYLLHVPNLVNVSYQTLTVESLDSFDLDSFNIVEIYKTPDNLFRIQYKYELPRLIELATLAEVYSYILNNPLQWEFS